MTTRPSSLALLGPATRTAGGEFRPLRQILDEWMARLIIVACAVHVARHLPALVAPGTLPGVMLLLLAGAVTALALLALLVVRLRRR